MAQPNAMKLVASIFVAPDDDELRRVVSDALIDRADPWGELIGLQLAIAEKRGTTEIRKRAAELVKAHITTFAGPIAKVASTLARKKSLVFEKGFLSEVELDRRLVPRPAWEAAARAPHWATVRRVRLSILTTPLWWITKWIANPAATRSLRIIDVSGMQLERATLAGPWTVTKTGGAKFFGANLAAIARGLPRAERARIAFAPKIATKHRLMHEAALQKV